MAQTRISARKCNETVIVTKLGPYRQIIYRAICKLKKDSIQLCVKTVFFPYL